jgi:hypothetical protein
VEALAEAALSWKISSYSEEKFKGQTLQLILVQSL